MEFTTGEIVCLFSNNTSSLWTCRRAEGRFVHRNVQCKLQARVPSYGYVCEVDSAFVVLTVFLGGDPVFLRLWKDNPFIFKLNKAEGIMENHERVKRWIPDNSSD